MLAFRIEVKFNNIALQITTPWQVHFAHGKLYFAHCKLYFARGKLHFAHGNHTLHI